MSLRSEGDYWYLRRLEGAAADGVTPVGLLRGKTYTVNEDRKATVTLRVTGLAPQPQPEPWKE